MARSWLIFLRSLSLSLCIASSTSLPWRVCICCSCCMFCLSLLSSSALVRKKSFSFVWVTRSALHSIAMDDSAPFNLSKSFESFPKAILFCATATLGCWSSCLSSASNYEKKRTRNRKMTKTGNLIDFIWTSRWMSIKIKRDKMPLRGDLCA